jgi:hypothetical protein
MTDHHTLIAEIFSLSAHIRYVAVYVNGQLTSKQKDSADSSSSESDKYEELLVNPALLTLARQRGDIDCGGLRYLVVAYGNFFQFVSEIPGGHISVCFGKEADMTVMSTTLHVFVTGNFHKN